MTFRVFWTTLLHTDPFSKFRHCRWQPHGDRDAPDFLCAEAKVGVELAEWLDKHQTSIARERDRFEKEIKEFIQSESFPLFQPGGAGITLALHIREIPSRRFRPAVIRYLLNFCAGEVGRNRSAVERQGHLCVPSSDLPAQIAQYFYDLQFFYLPGKSIGVSVQTCGAYNPEDALDSLERVLEDKIIRKAETYESARLRHRLTRLALVVYYDRALMWNAPFHGLGLSFTYGDDASEGVVADRAREFVSRLGNGQFEDIFLLFLPSPTPALYRLSPLRR